MKGGRHRLCDGGVGIDCVKVEKTPIVRRGRRQWLCSDCELIDCAKAASEIDVRGDDGVDGI